MTEPVVELVRFLVTDGRALNPVAVASEINMRWPSLSTADVARAVAEAACATPEALWKNRLVNRVIIAIAPLQQRRAR